MAKKLSQYDAILNASENTIIPILENGVNKKISADNLLKRNVINSLNSTEILKSLSAAQGKILKDALDEIEIAKQEALISGENIKTINGNSILGSGNIVVSEGSGLGGTNYVFVRGDGTPEENAIELQEAYNTAKTMPRYLGSLDGEFSGTYYKGQTFFVESDGYFIFDEDFIGDKDYANKTPITEEEALSCETTIVVAPGKYEFTTFFNVDTPYINIISLTGESDVKIYSSIVIVDDEVYSIKINTDNVYISGIDTIPYSLYIGGEFPNNTYNKCRADKYSFSYPNGKTLGKFIACISTYNSFGGIANGEAAGTFIGCIGGDFCFGTEYASGTFINCTGNDGCFGGEFGVAGGVFIDCIANTMSWINLTGKCINCEVKGTGFQGITDKAIAIDCKGFNNSFLTTSPTSLVINCKTYGGDGGFSGPGIFYKCMVLPNENEVSIYCFNGTGTYIDCISMGDLSFLGGICYNCIGGLKAFGGEGEADGIYINCIGGDGSFGGGLDIGGIASGTFINCIGGDGSFGGKDGGIVSGILKYCTGGIESFGSAPGGSITTTAKLYYCKLDSGTFPVPASGGKLVLCIDGTDAVITTV